MRNRYKNRKIVYRKAVYRKMNSFPFEYQLKCHDVLVHHAPIDAFEQWVYETADLENYLSADDYLELITLNYKKRDAKLALGEIIEKYLDESQIWTFEVQKSLKSILKNTEQLPDDLQKMYHWYCREYTFLERLAFHPAFDWLYVDYCIDKVKYAKELKEALTKAYPVIQETAQKLHDDIESGRIKILKAPFRCWEGEKPAFEIHELP
jgi:hypothetical protein